MLKKKKPGPKLLITGVLILILGLSGVFVYSMTRKTTEDINHKIERIQLNTATLEDIIKVFGEPEQYVWGDKTYTKDQLPTTYIARIKTGLSIVISRDRAVEIRIEGDESLTDKTGYIYKNKLKIGSSLKDVLEILGPPKKTVDGENNNQEDGVLYKNIGGEAETDYYAVSSQGVRVFLYKDKVLAIYLIPKSTSIVDSSANNTGSEVLSPKGQLIITKHPPAANYAMLQAKLTSLPAYNTNPDIAYYTDLRQKDLISLDLTREIDSLKHSFFDTETKWPTKMPQDFNPQKIMETGMNQGLGIRTLQARGITGKGVNIGIIDQALLVDHQEYKDRVKLYEEIHCLDGSASMHAPSMASLAVGKNIGVAPSADLYFIGNTDMNAIGNNQSELDYTSTAAALDRMLEINKLLPEGDKLRVISMSISFCPENKGYKELTQAIERAKQAGIFVVTCNLFETYGHQFWYQGLDRDPLADPDNIASYHVIPWKKWLSQIHHIDGTDAYYEEEFNKYQPKEVLLVPMTSKTWASSTGTDRYCFCREGGWSSVEPYLAGLYAMSCQVKPDVTPELFLSQAMKTGTERVFSQNGHDYTGKIIDPVKLIDRLQQ